MMASPLLHKISPKTSLNLKQGAVRNLPINFGRRLPNVANTFCHSSNDRLLNEDKKTVASAQQLIINIQSPNSPDHVDDDFRAQITTPVCQRHLLTPKSSNRCSRFRRNGIDRSVEKIQNLNSISPKRDSPTLLFAKFATTDACNALVQSPCRLEAYNYQRRKLYDTSFGCIGKENDQNLSSSKKSVYSGTPKIGKGGFGSVFQARYDGKPVAIKQLNVQQNDRINAGSLCAELNAFRLDHENIVKILTFSISDSVIQIVFEFVGRKTLQTLIDDVDELFDTSRRKLICLQISNALQFCHLNGVLHLDVKPSNVLIGNNNLCKLADFGCSRRSRPSVDLGNETNESKVTNQPFKLHPSPLSCPAMPGFTAFAKGTLAYQSPELLKGLAPTCACDVYSYGVLIWQLVTRRRPFDVVDPFTAAFCVVAKNWRPDRFVELDSELENAHFDKFITIAQACWAQEPNDRPSMSQVYDLVQKF